MTNNFKENLAGYVVAKLNRFAPVVRTRFLETDVLDDTPWDSVLPSNRTYLHYNGSVIDDISNNVILYGYYTENNVNKGIITILDETFTPIKSFTAYSNGTTLNPIQCMKQAEDGTYYLIDKTTRLRFVMVNNFSSQNVNGDYVLNFRTSYNFDSSFDNYEVEEMFKSGTSAKYVFFGMYSTNIKVTELEVNVGEPINWSTAINITSQQFGGAYALFNDEGVYWRLVTASSSNNEVSCYTKNYTSTTTSKTVLNTFDSSQTFQSKADGQCVFLDQNNIYFVTHEIKPPVNPIPHGKIGLYKYSFDDNSFTELYFKSLVGLNYDENISLNLCNGEIYIQYVTNIINTTGSLIPEQNGYHGDYYFQRLKSDTWSPVLYEENEYFYITNYLFVAKNNFNLVQLYSFYFNDFQRYILLLKDDFNVLNYNDYVYIDFNSLIPSKIRVYSNNSLMFARNIIDKTLIENKTVSTVIIPSSYLNNITLDKQTLLGETNMAIVEQNVPIVKNIYEAIYLNFIDRITSRSFLFGSSDQLQRAEMQIDSNTNSYVTQNINVGTLDNILDTMMGWLIVNYEDGTSTQNPIKWVYTYGTPNMYIFEFALDVQKAIISYEVKSYNLEQTYYRVFNNTYPTQLEVGKVYKIKQGFYVS